MTTDRPRGAPEKPERPKGKLTLLWYKNFCPYTVNLEAFRKARESFTIDENTTSIQVTMKNVKSYIYIVNVPFGVFIITKIFSSLPFSAFIYTKNSFSSTFPLNS